MISVLKKITNQILKCKPDAWTTRWPWVIAFGMLIHLGLGAVVLLTEWDVRYDTQYEIWVGFISIIMLLALVFYLIYLLRFNVFKRFGKLSKWHYLGTFLLYFLTMMIIVSWGYNPSAVTTISARTKYDEKNVAKDINRINTLINILEYDSIPHVWTRRQVILVRKQGRQNYLKDDRYATDKHQETVVNDGIELENEYISEQQSFYEDTRISRKDSFSFYSMLKTDSIQIINDTSFYRFYCADYTYITEYHDFFNERTESELGDQDLFHKIIKKAPIVTDRKNLIDELKQLIKKYWAKGSHVYRYNRYSHEPGTESKESNRGTCPEAYIEYINDKYNIYELDEGIKNISNRYYMWQSNRLGFLVYPLYYISLALSLLLFLFRHNRKKSFFYSLLAGVVLFILSATFLALTRSNSETVLSLMIVYMVVFGVLASGIFKAKRKSLLQDISKNLFIFFIPILPLVCTALYYNIKKANFRLNHDSSSPAYSELYHEAFKYEDLVIECSQVFGFILLLLLLQFVFSKMLRKAYALPEN